MSNISLNLSQPSFSFNVIAPSRGWLTGFKNASQRLVKPNAPFQIHSLENVSWISGTKWLYSPRDPRTSETRTLNMKCHPVQSKSEINKYCPKESEIWDDCDACEGDPCQNGGHCQNTDNFRCCSKYRFPTGDKSYFLVIFLSYTV